jgi:hypothetical protein
MFLTFTEGIKLYSVDAESLHVLYIVPLVHLKYWCSSLLKAADCLICILTASDSFDHLQSSTDADVLLHPPSDLSHGATRVRP